MAAPDLIHLRRSDVTLGLCPAIAGSIAAFRWRGQDVMRPAGTRLLTAGDPLEASCFPLVPFSNRIADGRFRFEGRAYQLAPNFPPEPHAIHGQGWQNPWQVAEREQGRAVLTLAHEVAGTPFDYQARQTFELRDDGLEVTIALIDQGAGPMPAGIGLHPYFTRTEGVTLRAALDHVWLSDARTLPRERVPVPDAWDLGRAPRVADLDLDHCFGGWDGRAVIHWPETDLRLSIDAEPPFGHLVVYVPPGADFFCVEPVSHVNDALNLAARGVGGTGLRTLRPGEQFAGRIRFTVIQG
jgi:aldose 1-epimerase